MRQLVQQDRKIEKAAIVVFTLVIAWSARAVLVSEEIPAAAISVAAESNLPFPNDMECVPQPVYRFRADGKPGREIVLNLKGAKIPSKAQVEIAADGHTETVKLPPGVGGTSSCRVLLPDNVAMTSEAQVTLTLRQGARNLTKTVTVPPMRHWTVYLYPHSHVDIGYSAPQRIVEFIHKRNIMEGIKLAQATKDYPEGARYRWNPEVTWPLERLWQTMPEEREHVLKAIRDGQLCVDASYLNLNTTVCCDEELFQMFRFSREMQRLTGVPMDTFQQMDVPGMTWGIVPVMAQEGVRYILAWPNSIRAGNTHSGIDQHPFWWIGPDGKSKVLFLQPGSYCNSGSGGKGGATGRPWMGQHDTDKIPAVIKTGSANVDFTDTLANAEKAKFPYDFQVFSWSLWDNSLIDADVPDAVKAWNEQHAYPHIVIAGGHQIMSEIEKKYGNKLPVVKGDFTEYWTDGPGTAARVTAINRNAKERLTQAETLWTMLRPGRPAPRADFDEAWRYVELGDEHTWCSENPTEPYFQDEIWKVKQSYFREADDRSQTLLDDALAPATDKSNGGLGPADGPSQGGIAVFNNHSWEHGGLVMLSPAESSRGNRVLDEQGGDVPAQRLSTGELVFLASDVPAFGSRHFRVVKGGSPLPDGCTLGGTTLENKYLHVVLDPATGDIIQLVDLATGHNFADAKLNGGLNSFRWLPGNRNEPKADTDIVISTAESGPLVVESRVLSKAAGCRSVSRSVRLVAGQPWVEISDVVDKLPLVAKDGIHFGFGFDIPQGRTSVDIPLGVMEVEKDQWPQANRNWIAMQRWLDISNDKEGVTWCSLDTPLFEYGSITANLVTTWGDGGAVDGGPWIRKLEPSSTVYSWVMNNHWFTNFRLTQDGPVAFRYRILPHGAYDAAAANRFGLEQAQPLAHVPANNDPKLKSLVVLDNERVFVTLIKPLGDLKAAILRLRSVSDKPETVKLTWPAGQPKAVHVCYVEEPSGEPIGGSLSLPSYGSITLRMDFN
jgi:alpha-mannosidase